jgi:hypothetical protein
MSTEMINVALAGTEEFFEMFAIEDNEIAEYELVKKISVTEYQEYQKYIQQHNKWQDRIIDLFDAI